MGVWDNKDNLALYEEVRGKHRLAGKRLTFDCPFMIVREGDKAYCSKGKLSHVSLIQVIKGVTYVPCLTCEFFPKEEE